MIEANNITKTYSSAGRRVHALEGVDLSVEQGDFIVIHGASGSGKTTLLLALGGMLRPTKGEVTFQERDIYSLSSRRRNQFRRRCVGFIFQKFFLVPYLTASENIRLSLVLRRYRGNHRQRIFELAERLGIADRLSHRPSQLSVGEQQRVAMARAIAAEPELILADEPTGNLDRDNTDAFAEFLTDENRRGRTILMVTHDERLLDVGTRTVRLCAGRLPDAE